MSATTGSVVVAGAAITDAEFRLLCQFISNNLQSGGVTKTADTGQVDTATVTRPGSTNTVAGYEIRTFTDTLQATVPIFIKLEYGTGATTGQFGVSISVGTGSNGSGTLTGVLQTDFRLNTGSGAATHTMWLSADTNRFVFKTKSNANAFTLSLERSHNLNKTDNSNGAYIIAVFASGSLTTGWYSRYLKFGGGGPVADNAAGAGGCFPPYAQSTGLNSDGSLAVYPFYMYGVGETLVPSLNVAGAFTTDFTAESTYLVSLLGSNQTMLMGHSLESNSPARGQVPGISNFRPMTRYD